MLLHAQLKVESFYVVRSTELVILVGDIIIKFNKNYKINFYKRWL